VPGPKTNEREGTRAVLRFGRVSPYKMRAALDMIRGRTVEEAGDILRFCERDAAIPIAKLLGSAVANAQHNDQQDADELYVSACFADEGTTMKRWRPRARGRATRIRKRTSHVTIIVSRLPDEELAKLHARKESEQAARRARRVAGARRAESVGTGAGTAARPGRLASRRRRAEEAAAAAQAAEAEAAAQSAETEASETAESAETAEAAAAEAAEPDVAEAEHAGARAEASETADVETADMEAEAGADAHAEADASPAEDDPEGSPGRKDESS
jgi:large subunit ribosomal protein L22